MSTRCRTAPASVRRQLRQEAGFGCAICGNPLIESAHIIEYSITHSFPSEDMVALCPNCHTEADLGKFAKWYLRKVKNEPFNKNRQTIGKRFVITGENTVVHLGNSTFVNTYKIITVSDFELVAIRKAQDGFLSLDVNLFDIFNGFIAIIYDNYWLVDRRYTWDIVYKPQHLKLYCAQRNILFEIEIKKEEIFISGTLYFNGFPIPITDQSMRVGGIVLSNFNTSWVEHAIDLQLH